VNTIINGFELKLIVPPQDEIRRGIKTIVDEFFSSQIIIPPISYKRIAEYALQLTHDNSWDSDYYAFALVCCGNAIWRPVVESIPFERRILLLPECLKNSANCKAETDTLGLLCTSCGACSISEIISYAEDLGYITMVTEGTTVATRLIESGKVDAIIGVGCMESLQKIFESITKYAVPGLGIPLPGNGCINTVTDVEWLKKEIRSYKHQDDIKLLNLIQLRNRVELLFTDENIKRITQQGNSKTEKIAREVLIAAGQHWRPFLTSLVYESLCPNPKEEIAYSLGLSVECFHKASLIHDDIEDGDAERNGSESLHKKYGIALALNIGDLLIGEGYKILAHSNLPANIIALCSKIAADGHVALTLGQGEELWCRENNTILSVNETLELFKNKTSAAFNVSLLMGAVAAKADARLLDILEEFGNHLGLAYQIKDDMADFKGNKGDICAGNLSILVSMLFESIPMENRNSVQALLNDNKSQEVFALMETYGIENKTAQLLDDYIQKAYNCLDKIETIGLKLALHEIMGKIFRVAG
jgi:geranylgeranyl pyrophosphate synthase